MAAASLQIVSTECISTPKALRTLVQSFVGLPNNPASLYLSVDHGTLVIYIAPARTVNVVDLSYLSSALQQKDGSASTLKKVLETGVATKVFFDARTPAKVLFDRCGIKRANDICTERAHIHEVQMMELALRRSDTDRKWFAGLDKCITNDSNLRLDMLVWGSPNGCGKIDERILHLPVLWEKYHTRLVKGRNGCGGSFWIAMVREATQKRLAVSCGEKHRGYAIASAESAWNKDSIDEQRESWNDDIFMDMQTHGEFIGGAEHWAKFEIL